MSRSLCAAIAAPAVLSVGVGSVLADNTLVSTLNFPIEGQQAVPAITTETSGVGQVRIYEGFESEYLLEWELFIHDLKSEITGLYIHGNALPGSIADVIFDIGAISDMGEPISGSTMISKTQFEDLNAGLWYVNLMTEDFPTGEVRGQIVPSPGGALLLGFAGIAAVRRRRR